MRERLNREGLWGLFGYEIKDFKVYSQKKNPVDDVKGMFGVFIHGE
ncbi:MAG: hypothetical protein PVF58_16315 [Candidatus Methanofastidiosia archaeon]|jgi:hypothetical protein